MPLKSKILLSVAGFVSGVGGAKFGFDHGEPEFESVVTQEREEFARRASIYTVYYDGIVTTQDGKKYPNVKKVSLTPLSNVVLDNNKVLEECELKGNSQDRAYAFWDQSLKRWSCENYFQHKDWLSESKDKLEKSEFISEGEIVEEMEGVRKMEGLLMEYKKEVNENREKVKGKCKEEYSKLFNDSPTDEIMDRFCTITMSYIGYQ